VVNLRGSQEVVVNKRCTLTPEMIRNIKQKDAAISSQDRLLPQQAAAAENADHTSRFP
jgi:hypothetical protein